MVDAADRQLPLHHPARAAVDPRRVTVGGLIDRRICITIHRNLFAIDVEEDFLRLPFDSLMPEIDQTKIQPGVETLA